LSLLIRGRIKKKIKPKKWITNELLNLSAKVQLIKIRILKLT